MEFLVVGLNHRSAPLEVRERLSLSPDRLPTALRAMAAYGVPGVILSTCNRSEFYALEPDGADGPDSTWGVGDQRIKDFLVDFFHIPLLDVERYLYLYRDQDCIGHLFRVASSLDSMVLGEDQIIGQVREAFHAAVQAETVQKHLFHLFQQALRVGRRVRRETGIGRSALSVSRACVEMAKSSLGDLSGLRAMVVGAGDAGGLAAEMLRQSGVEEITVTNRTHERAKELARALGGRAVPFQDMRRALRDSDLVITCTGSPGYVLGGDVVRKAMEGRPHRPLFLMDIAVPRDIDPAAGQISNVFLRNVDDLEAVSETSRLQKVRETEWAEGAVAEETERFLGWCFEQQTLPTVIALRDKAEKIRQKELSKTIRKLNLELSPDQSAALEAMTRAIVKKLLHGPTVYLKGHGNSGNLRAAREIFQIQDEDP